MAQNNGRKQAPKTKSAPRNAARSASASGKRPTAAKSNRTKAKRPTRGQIMVRRVVFSLLVLALAGLVIWGAWAATKAITQSLTQNSKVEPTANPVPTSSAEWAALDEQERLMALKGRAPEVCPADSVKVSVDIANRSGGAFNVVAHITNDFPVPCLVDTTDARIATVITSGDETIWTSASCAGDSQTLLLPAGEETSRTIVWPGQHRTSGCEAGDKAKPGVYKARVSVGGAEDSATFEVR
ncbi:hypothetical protein SAMN02910418_00634 [Bowdeniella nasicola]|uniref:Uncharacterized protein n=2 Tax=Bowdeniella nasicola TaxID=208480 RepID=A0A1H3X7F1_9ACTO|nr:hypothetical protein SAMN02910418_00634 [Bowdeniella nasicola]